MRRSILLLALALGCARELDLPERPAPAPAEAPEIFLGSLSGIYALELVGDGGQQIPLPGAEILIALQPPTGTDEAPVLGFGEATGRNDGLFLGSIDGVRLTGRSSDGSALEVRRGVGGGTLSFGAVHRVCPTSTPLDIQAHRVCGFDPSLSGIYDGVETACDGSAPHPVRIALVQLDGMLLGMLWPETDRLLVVSPFDPLVASGMAQLYDVEALVAGADEALSDVPFALREEGEDGLVLTFDRLTPDGASCASRVRAARPAGGESVRCPTAELLGDPLDVAFWSIEVDGRPALGVTLSETGGVASLDPLQGLCIEAVLRTTTGDALPQIGDPGTLPQETTLAFELPARLPEEPVELELILRWACGERRRPIQPICIAASRDALEQRF